MALLSLFLQRFNVKSTMLLAYCLKNVYFCNSLFREVQELEVYLYWDRSDLLIERVKENRERITL